MADRLYTIPFWGPPGDALAPIDPHSRRLQPHGEFVVGPENQLAATAVERVIESLASERTTMFNPLVLYGPSASGKSHLAHGLARCCRDQFGRWAVVCLPAVEFAQAWRDAIEIEAADHWRRDVRKTRLLVIDDLHQIQEKSGAQQELVCTCDEMIAGGQQVVFTLERHPAETPGLLRSLAARLVGGLTVRLSFPERDARREILSRLAAARQITLSAATLDALAGGLKTSARELAGAIVQLELTCQGAIDEDAVERFLARRSSAPPPCLSDIAKLTAKRYSLRVADLRSSARGRSLVTARGVAMLLARRMTGMSFRRIGAFFGGRDHTTVMHACRRTETLSASDAATGDAVSELRQALTQHRSSQA